MFSEVLKSLRLKAGLTQSELAEKLDVGKSTISMYENGNRTPRFEDLEAIADFFNVSLDRLTGNKSTEPSTTTGLIKLYDGIPAGAPAFLDDYVIDHIPTLLPNPDDYAAIIVHGDSMIGRSIIDGCTVIIKKQDCADNGQIVACRVNNDEVTLKIFSQQGNTVVLSPANPNYSPIIVPVSEFENGSAQILGVAVKIETDII